MQNTLSNGNTECGRKGDGQEKKKKEKKFPATSQHLDWCLELLRE